MGQTVVLIGANGSGESNLIRFFEMLSWMLRARRLAEFIERQGGADDQLFGGRKATPIIQAELLENPGSAPKDRPLDADAIGTDVTPSLDWAGVLAQCSRIAWALSDSSSVWTTATERWRSASASHRHQCAPAHVLNAVRM